MTEELKATKAQLAQGKQAPPTTTPTTKGPTQEVQELQTTIAQLNKDIQTTKAELFKATQSEPKAEPTGEIQTLKTHNAKLTKELQEMKAQIISHSVETKDELGGFHPEVQSLQDELQNMELQNQLLDNELSTKIHEIKELENRLSVYTSLATSSSPVDESVG